MFYKNFEEAFVAINTMILDDYDFECNSRLGKMREIINVSYTVENPHTYKFQNDQINRIDYKYAEVFYDFMISGGNDAETAFKDYPMVSRFIKKIGDLPDNYNSLYGPRIKRQLPAILKELKEQDGSRRAVIKILNEEDNILLGSNETIEYPCTMAVMYLVRNNKLYCHVNMRSQNTAVVMQIDMYLFGKMMEYVAKELNLELGKFSSNIVSAHIFERDFEYIKTFI